MRKVKRRHPTLIGMAVAKPTTPIDAPKIVPPSSGPTATETAPQQKRKGFPAPKKGGLGGLPRSRLPPRSPQKRPSASEPLDALPTQVAALDDEEPKTIVRLPSRSKMDAWVPAAVPSAPDGATDAPDATSLSSDSDPLIFNDLSATGPLPQTGSLPEPFESEVTQVSDSPEAAQPEAAHADPAVEIPDGGDLATVVMLPGASPAQGAVAEPEIPAPRTTSPEPMFEELQAGSTAIVKPGDLQGGGEVYRLDLRSGELAREVPSDETPVQQKSRAGLIVGGVLGAMIIIVGGIGIGYSLTTSDPEVVETEGELPANGASTESEESGETAGTADTEVADTNTADTDTADTEVADTDTADTDTADTEVADTDTAEASIASIEAYEFERPETSSRARRMPEEARRRQSGRLRARALRAYRSDNWAEAATQYRAALTYNDWDVASMEGMARTTARQGNFPEAVAWAQLAVQRNSRSAATYRVLGDVWRQAGHPDRARTAWRRGLRRNPDDRWLRQRIRELEEP